MPVKTLLTPTDPHAPIATRPHWVKMRYPDGMYVVGVVHDYHGLWVFDHRTDDTQASPNLNAPMGLDVGTYAYLCRQSPKIDAVHFWPEGSSKMLAVAFSAFADRLPVPSRTTKGQHRTRLFLPTSQWSIIDFYPDQRLPYWQVTHIKENGEIEAQHVPA